MKIKNPKSKIQNYQSGFTAFFVTVLIFFAIFAISAGIFILTYGEQKIVYNIIKSSQAYYAAEAGIEDALLRLVEGLDWSSPYRLSVGENWATTTISDIIGGSRTIIAQGHAFERIRKVRASYEISADSVSFYYGAQIGEGGLLMDDNSKVIGNVFSNATAQGSSNSQITGTIWVAQNGNKIKNLNVGGDAYAHTCENSTIGGTLTYVSGGSVVNCTASSGIQQRPNEIAPKELPIPESQINEWKNAALAGGVITSDYLLDGAKQAFLGPQKIEGSLIVDDNAHLFITGPLWVTGNIRVENNARVSLDSATYNSLSGVIIGDNLITLQNNSISSGSGQPGSYLMYISTAPFNPAVILKNLAIVDVIFTSNGWIEIQNNVQLREVTGYGIHLKNNIEIKYEVGLEEASFSSGPGGSWEVTSWEETE